MLYTEMSDTHLCLRQEHFELGNMLRQWNNYFLIWTTWRISGVVKGSQLPGMIVQCRYPTWWQGNPSRKKMELVIGGIDWQELFSVSLNHSHVTTSGTYINSISPMHIFWEFFFRAPHNKFNPDSIFFT